MNKIVEMHILKEKIKDCTECPDLNIGGITENAPGYGNIDSPVFVIGQSLCTECMKTQIPFTLGSGVILDKAFKSAGIQKSDIFISNLVHCHPPNNRPSMKYEIDNCLPYLYEEIEIVNPLLIIGLGNDVRNTLMKNTSMNMLYRCLNGKFGGRTMVFVYHPAYFYRRGGVKGKETRRYIQLLAGILRRFV